MKIHNFFDYCKMTDCSTDWPTDRLFVGVGSSFKISVLAKGKIDIGNNLRNYWFNLLCTTNTLKCCFKTSQSREGFNRNSFKLSIVPSKTSKTLPKLKCVCPNFKILSKTPHSNSRGKLKNAISVRNFLFGRQNNNWSCTCAPIVQRNQICWNKPQYLF